ncbi:hypothetical protein [Butyricimonas synergistica]|uniref:hypothetical protein n=1 Tax=Butyricimonas synergistica TaxID=544644 RepID=UPI000379489C|nr:hypothetical protein [Butyricimonas synergistica]
MKLHLIYIFILAASLVACNDDNSLTPTETPEFGYSVPQGNHDYDDRIVDWNKRCNTFILYKFDLKELYWDVNRWNESTPTPEDSSYPYPYSNGLLGAIADEVYVGEQLDLVETLFLDFYPDSTLYRLLPLKLLLCGELNWRTVDGKVTFYNVYSGYDYLAFNWGNEDVLTMTNVQKNTFKNEVNYAFLTRLLNSGRIVEDASFYEGMNYEDKVTQTNMYERGFIKSGTKQEDDVEIYIQAIIQTPYEDLIAEPADKDYTNKGILHAKKDVNGYIRKKYDILVNKFKENYGIDLQSIGNVVLK